MSYLEEFLDCYDEHIEHYESLIFILSLLPDSYQYVFAKNLLKYENFLVDGNYYEGIKPTGSIKISGEKIVLEIEEKTIVLLHLPPLHEI